MKILFYIFEEKMDRDYKVTNYIDKEFVPVIIAADNEEAALDKFCQDIDPDERWRFYAREVSETDEEERTLKELGYKSWDDYHRDMYPERPIEL